MRTIARDNRKGKMNEGINRYGYFFILPFFVVFILFHLYPIIYTLYLSFTKYDGLSDPLFIGLQNYLNLLRDEQFWQAFGNTWKIWTPNIILQLGFALLFASWLTNRQYRIRGVSTFRTVFFFPNLVTAASIALLFNVLLDWQNGAVNQLFFGTEDSRYIDWLGRADFAQIIISLIQTWIWFGYTMILFMAGMNSIPASLYEAAAVDGASNRQVFVRVTMPLLRPILAFVFITSLIGGMQLFDIPFVITLPVGSGGPEKSLVTSVSYLYRIGFRLERFGYASAIAYTIFVLILAFSILYLKLINRQREEIS